MGGWIQFSENWLANRLMKLENEFDLAQGRMPRNRLTCTRCSGSGVISHAYGGGWNDCQECDGLRKIIEANEKLEAEARAKLGDVTR